MPDASDLRRRTCRGSNPPAGGVALSVDTAVSALRATLRRATVSGLSGFVTYSSPWWIGKDFQFPAAGVIQPGSGDGLRCSGACRRIPERRPLLAMAPPRRGKAARPAIRRTRTPRGCSLSGGVTVGGLTVHERRRVSPPPVTQAHERRQPRHRRPPGSTAHRAQENNPRPVAVARPGGRSLSD